MLYEVITIRAITESGKSAAALREQVDERRVTLGKGSVAPDWVSVGIAAAAGKS